MKKMISKVKLNSNDLLQICLITVLSILLFNRRKYTFPIFIHITGTTILSFSFTKNLINSLLTSLFFTYVMLTFFYKVKVERFISFNFSSFFDNLISNKKKENKENKENKEKKEKKENDENDENNVKDENNVNSNTDRPLTTEEICTIEDDSLFKMPKKKWSCEKKTTTTIQPSITTENAQFSKLSNTLNDKLKN